MKRRTQVASILIVAILIFKGIRSNESDVLNLANDKELSKAESAESLSLSPQAVSSPSITIHLGNSEKANSLAEEAKQWDLDLSDLATQHIISLVESLERKDADQLRSDDQIRTQLLSELSKNPKAVGIALEKILKNIPSDKIRKHGSTLLDVAGIVGISTESRQNVAIEVLKSSAYLTSIETPTSSAEWSSDEKGFLRPPSDMVEELAQKSVELLTQYQQPLSAEISKHAKEVLGSIQRAELRLSLVAQLAHN